MITLEEIAGKSVEEIADIYTKDVENYKESIEKLTITELHAEEEKVIGWLQEYDEYIKGIVYQIPKSVEWDGHKFTHNDIYSKIIYFLNKNEVQWSYTLGMYELVKFWRNFSNSEISYGAFDSTLRLLEQVKFKGYEEWRDILAINEFFKPLHADYSKDISRQIYLSKLHQELLSRMELITPMNGETQEKEA